jgi:glyoxylase-like metal-dependent hydrolase (beta-lactamase superfamily II)
MARELGPAGEYLLHCFGQFNFEGITFTPPTKTFSGEMQVQAGDKTVQLIEVGPAHTRGDILAYCPDDKTVFTGDILFIEGTPIMWQGPVANWIAACRRIEAMDVETIVPGHGPICGKPGVVAVREYLEFVRDEARSRFDAGLSAREAARDIELGEYGAWSDPERIAVNVNSLYREFDQDAQAADILELFTQMAELAGFSRD